MNILDMMNKLAALSQPVTEAKTSTGNAFDLKTKVTPEKEKAKSFVHKGKYGMEYQGDPDDEELDDKGKKKKKAPKAADEKRGRGRPKKGADNAGNVAKPDWSAFGAKKDVKLPKWDKAKTTKHSLKDWIENLDDALNEAFPTTSTATAPQPGQKVLVKPGQPSNEKPPATMTTQSGQTVATGPADQVKKLGDLVNTGNISLTKPGTTQPLDELKNHMGETEYHGYYKWRVACRKAGATEFVGDKDIDEGHDASGQAVGEWDGVVGTVYGDAHKANPAQDPYDQDDPAPMEEGLGGQMFIMLDPKLGQQLEQLDGVDVDYDSETDDEGNVSSPRYAGNTATITSMNPNVTAKLMAFAQKNPQRLKISSSQSDTGTGASPAGNLWGAASGPALAEAKKKAKPDFLDKDKDGNKKEPFKKAVKDAKNPADSKYDSRAGRRNGRDDVKAKQVEEGKDEGKPGKNFAKIAKSAGKEYGSKAAGERVAGAVKAKLAKQGKLEEGKVKELSMDLEDRTMKDAEFKKKYGKGRAEMKASLTQKPADKKPASKIKESILRESRETLQHIINRFKHETKNFVAGGDLDEDLYDALFDYYCDEGEMPYGVAKARSGDPYEWVTERFDQDVLDHDVPMDEGAYSQDYFTANMDKPQREPVPRQSTPPLPKQTPWKRDPIAAATDRVYDVFNRPKAGTGDVQFESWDNALTSLLNEGINVTANTGLGDGPDSVSISATDEDAQKLLAIVKSAGLGMFGGEAHSDEEGSPQMSIQGQENPEADIDVVDDHDGMLSLIRKMTGQGDAPAQSNAEVEVDEEETPDQGEEVAAENTPTFGGNEPDQEGSSEEEVQQATDKLEKVHDVWSQAGSDDGEESDEVDEGEPKGGEDLSHEDTKDMSQDEVDHALDKDLEDDEEEDLDEAYANDADDTFETDIAFMQEVITGGVNGKKRTQSVGNPVTIASTPMRESTDLLKDWKTLSGIK